MIVCDNSKKLTSKKLKSTINELLYYLNSFDNGLIIISGSRNSNFVLKYTSSYLSKHSLISLEFDNYDKIPDKLKTIFENNFNTIYFFNKLNLELVYSNSNSKSLINSCELMISSGTSGVQKVVVWDKKKLNHHIKRINKSFQVDKSISELIIMPVTHSFGLMRLRCAIERSSDIYIASSVSDLKFINKVLLETEKLFIAGVVSGLEMFFEIFLDLIKNNNFKYWFESGSMRMSKNLITSFIALSKFKNFKFKHHYGSTEFTRFSLIDFSDLIQNQTLILKNDRNDFIVKESELFINPEGWFEGYLDVSGLLSNYDSIIQGKSYLKTGDLIKKNEIGYSYHLRNKEIINVNGLKFNVIKLENELISTFPNIKDCLIIQKINDKGFKVFVESKLKENNNENDIIKSLFVRTSYISKIEYVDKILYTNSLKKIRNLKSYEV
tara:strand:+ start:450 stop:1766 length:1317 start_codon:yes stop_codon:yes gene_type:complete